MRRLTRGSASPRPAGAAAVAAAAALFAVASSSSRAGAAVSAFAPIAGRRGEAMRSPPPSSSFRRLRSSSGPAPPRPLFANPHPHNGRGRHVVGGGGGQRRQSIARLFSSPSSSPSGPIADPRASSSFVLDPRSDEARSLTSAMGIDRGRHDALADLTALVVQWNERVNLISRKECTEEVVFGRHVLPSAALCAVRDSPLGRLSPSDTDTDADADARGGGEGGEAENDAAGGPGPNFEAMTVAELKEILKGEGRPVSGKKAELIERLQSPPPPPSSAGTSNTVSIAADDDDVDEKKEGRKLKVADVGTGGGFPGLPLAILYPHVDFLLIDSVGKKLKVVEAMAEELGLDNVKIHNGRAEELVDDVTEGRRHEGAYDLVLGRSVASLPRFCFWVSDLLRKKKKGEGNGGDEGKLMYVVGGEVEGSVVARLQSDTPIDELLGRAGASDKRALILAASDVARIAAESGEVKKKKGGGGSGSGKRKGKGKSRPKTGQGRAAAKGEWKKKSNAAPKQRGYENFKRYNG